MRSCPRYALYLTDHPRNDAKLFEEITSDIIIQTQGTYDDLLKDDPSLPQGFAASAVSGDFILTSLFSGSIIHEYTVHPGRMFFNKIKSKIKIVICGEGGPYEQLKERETKKVWPEAMVSEIITSYFNHNLFWVPIVAYISIIILKIGLNIYCEE